MRRRAAIVLIAVIVPVHVRTYAQAAGGEDQARQDSAVRSVLRQEAYPWYDSQEDTVRPLLPDPSSWSNWLVKKLQAVLDWLAVWLRPRTDGLPGAGVSRGQWLPTFLFLAAGGLFAILLWRLWRLYEPEGPKGAKAGATVGAAARVAGLPSAAGIDGVDPWAEAQRQRAAGDPRSAIIWLFLDQLLSLEQAGLIRLAAGKTARQYVMMVRDPALASGLQTTLHVFEDVYYGHRTPDSATMSRVWSRAEAFRQRLSASPVGATR